MTLTGLGSGMASTMDAGYQETAGQLFHDFEAKELSDFVASMERVLGHLRRSMPIPERATG